MLSGTNALVIGGAEVKGIGESSCDDPDFESISSEGSGSGVAGTY